MFTTGPMRIANFGGASVSDRLYYTVIWFKADAQGIMIPQITTDATRRQHGGHTLSGFSSYEYLSPPSASEHGWIVRITIPAQSANSGASIGNALQVDRLRDPIEVD